MGRHDGLNRDASENARSNDRNWPNPLLESVAPPCSDSTESHGNGPRRRRMAICHSNSFFFVIVGKQPTDSGGHDQARPIFVPSAGHRHRPPCRPDTAHDSPNAQMGRSWRSSKCTSFSLPHPEVGAFIPFVAAHGCARAAVIVGSGGTRRATLAIADMVDRTEDRAFPA
jgi:hypothetical protein